MGEGKSPLLAERASPMSAPSTTIHKPTAEQQAVLDYIANESGNLDIDALAGAAKSTTLKMAAPLIQGNGVILAFNFAIKEEIKAWAPANFEALTLNGLGHRAWQRMVGRNKLQVKDYKVSSIMKQMGLQDPLRTQVRQIVMACKAHGLVPKDHGSPGLAKSFIPDTPEGWLDLENIADLELSPEAIDLAKVVLRTSIKEAFSGNIDFADQIYMSCCFSATFPTFEVGFVDEAQDLSPLNHYMVQKCLARGRFVGVGDERQSIYAFRGADSDSIGKLRSVFQTQTRELTTTFRCAQTIVENVHWHAPSMRAAPWAPAGKVSWLSEWGVHDIEPESAVISRNNAPLFAVGFALLQAGIPIKFLGKGLEQGLASTISQASNRNPNAPADEVHAGIERWRAEECAKAEAVGNDTKVERTNDKADALLSIPGRDAQEILENLGKLLNADNGSITLCTGHKSKGLEFPKVYHLDPDSIGRGKNLTEKQRTQENNLKYVIDTRPKVALTYIKRKGWIK